MLDEILRQSGGTYLEVLYGGRFFGTVIELTRRGVVDAATGFDRYEQFGEADGI